MHLIRVNTSNLRQSFLANDMLFYINVQKGTRSCVRVECKLFMG